MPEGRTRMTVAEIDAALARISTRLDELSADAPKESVISTSAKGKMIVSAVLMMVAVVAMVFSTLAYYTAFVYSSGNVIATGKTEVEFVDLNAPTAGGSAGTELDPISFMPGHLETRKIYAKNSGNMPLYVRVKAETAITLAERYAAHSDEIDVSLVKFVLKGSAWELRDGYYYYVLPLCAGESTPELFDHIEFDESMGNIYKDSIIRIRIVFEIVQATNNGDTVFEAVGWATETEGGAP